MPYGLGSNRACRRTPPKPHGGRPRIPDRACLTGIIFVLKSGIPWELLPAEMGCGSGMACWRRLRDWQAAGVWDRLHQTLLDELGTADQINWSRACLDSASVPAKKRGDRHGTESYRSRQTWHQAPCDHRPARNPLGRPAHWGQPP